MNGLTSKTKVPKWSLGLLGLLGLLVDELRGSLGTPGGAPGRAPQKGAVAKAATTAPAG